MKTVQCPSCGASATNLENCEFCGSLFVRYPSNDIKIKINTSPNAFEGFIFPNLKEALLENIAFQSNSEPLTDICLLDHTVIIQVVSSSTLVDFFNNPSKPGLGIYLAFDDDKETEKKVFEDLKKISKDLSILIISHNPDIWNYCNKLYEMKNKNLIKIK